MSTHLAPCFVYDSCPERHMTSRNHRQWRSGYHLRGVEQVAAVPTLKWCECINNPQKRCQNKAKSASLNKPGEPGSYKKRRSFIRALASPCSVNSMLTLKPPHIPLRRLHGAPFLPILRAGCLESDRCSATAGRLSA